MTRRGFTLVELLVTLTVLAIMGTALTRILINQSHYVGQQEGLMEARQIARQAMNLITTELQMVSDGGVIAVSADSITVRVPYAFGMLCRSSGSKRTAALMPADSVAWANAVVGGVAWRTGTTYTFGSGISVATSTDTAECTADSIRAQSGGRLVSLTPANVTSAASSGDIMYLYEKVTYKFASSAALSGRRALWRTSGGVSEELLAPFADSARFAYLTGSRLSVTTTVPASVDSLRGLELRLIAESVSTPSGRTTPMEYDLRPRVRFGNYAY